MTHAWVICIPVIGTGPAIAPSQPVTLADTTICAMSTVHDHSTPNEPSNHRAERPEMIGHLFMGPDQRSPLEQREAQRREHARRTGKGRANWWKREQAPGS